MTQPSILAVVLHYGDPALTRNVHQALLRGADESAVLVIDNAAPQPYAGALRLPDNVFWGGALELSLQLAHERGYSHLWFCNNDITFAAPPAMSLLAFAAGRLARLQTRLGKAVGLWAPAVTANPYHQHMVYADGPQYRRVEYVDGIAPILNLECVAAVGGVDKGDNARGYGLDLWLSMRAYAAGWPVVVDHKVLVRHRYHATARREAGFLAQAARDEDIFLTARLGADWREIVRERASRWNDVNEL